jgi:hypothetical protein
MARLTITEAARVTGVSRVTLHRYIKAGKLSRSPDGTLDTAELLRIGLVLQPDTVLQPLSLQRDVTPPETASVPVPDAATLQQLLTLLQRELDAAHAREEAARERETLLLQMLSQLQHQNQRLLDLPRHVPALTPRETPQNAPGATQPSRRPQNTARPVYAPPDASRRPAGDDAAAHRGTAPGLSRGADPSRDAGLARRGQESRRYVSRHAAGWARAAGGAWAVWGSGEQQNKKPV